VVVSDRRYILMVCNGKRPLLDKMTWALGTLHWVQCFDAVNWATGGHPACKSTAETLLLGLCTLEFEFNNFALKLYS